MLNKLMSESLEDPSSFHWGMEILCGFLLPGDEALLWPTPGINHVRLYRRCWVYILRSRCSQHFHLSWNIPLVGSWGIYCGGKVNSRRRSRAALLRDSTWVRLEEYAWHHWVGRPRKNELTQEQWYLYLAYSLQEIWQTNLERWLEHCYSHVFGEKRLIGFVIHKG